MTWDLVAVAFVVAAALASLALRLRKPSCGSCPAAAGPVALGAVQAKSSGDGCGCAQVPLHRLALHRPSVARPCGAQGSAADTSAKAAARA